MLSENRFLYIISTFIIYHLYIPFIVIFVAVFSQTIIQGIPFQELDWVTQFKGILWWSIFLFILIEIGGLFYPTIGWALGHFGICEPKFYGKAIENPTIIWIANCTILFPLLPALIVSYYLPFKKNQVRKKREEREGEEEKKEEN